MVFYLPSLVITSQRDVPYQDTTNSIGGKGKDKFHPITSHKVTDGNERHSHTLSLNSALNGVGS